MTQFDFPTLLNSNSGAELVVILNSWVAAVESMNSGPTEPVYKRAGLMWRDTSSTPWVVKIYDGAQWVPQFEINPSTHLITKIYGPDATGSNSGFLSAALFVKLNALPDNATLTNLLDAKVGVQRFRVRVAATGNVSVSTGLAAGQNVDGVTLAEGDYVLLPNQSTAAQNGVYVAPSAGAASRATEFDTYNLHPGALIAVEEGSTLADTLWLCTSNKGGTLGSTAIAFENLNTRYARLGALAQVITGGFRVTSQNLGTRTNGTETLDPGNGPLQRIINGGTFTIQAPSFDGAFTLEITNNSSAGVITFSGFASGHPRGDSISQTNGHKFLLSINRTNGTTYCTVLSGQ